MGELETAEGWGGGVRFLLGPPVSRPQFLRLRSIPPTGACVWGMPKEASVCVSACVCVSLLGRGERKRMCVSVGLSVYVSARR